MVGSMENKNMKRLLNYIKGNDIIKKYQIIFDKYFNFESLLLISDEDVDKIICTDEYFSIINLYEVINDVKIDDDIKQYIHSLEDKEVIKYCLRLSISQEFDNEEKKYEYIKALGKSNRDSVRFAYGIASSKLYIESIDGIDYVRMISGCKGEVALHLIDILHSNKYRNDENFYEFINLVKDTKEAYIAEYMVDLFKNEDSIIERIPVSSMAILMCSKGRKQAYYASNILTNDILIEKGLSNSIAFMIAMCEEEEIAHKAYLTIMDNSIINNDDIMTIIDNLMEKENNNYNEEINIIDLLKTRNIEEILKILNTIPDNIQLNSKVKVK